jgi:peptidoglycan/LPS O-acetylase OafA/YrhL
MEPSRVRGVDGLRAIAAISIAGYHVWSEAAPGQQPVEVGRVFDFALANLQFGVTLFFVLSGFLLWRPFARAAIAGRPLPSIKRYIKRRVLRIMPGYWAALLVVALVLGSQVNGDERPFGAFRESGVLVRDALLVQNYSPRTVTSGITPAWSLCVEAVFYILVPLFVLVVGRKALRSPSGRRRVAWLLAPAVVLLFVGASGRIAAHLVAPGPGSSDPGWDHDWHSVIVRSFWCQADLFSVGIGLAVLDAVLRERRAGLTRLVRRATVVAGAAVVGVCLWRVGDQQLADSFWNVPMALGLGLLTVPVLLGATERDARAVRLLESRPVVAAGLASYSVFLLNEPVVLFLLHNNLTRPGVAGLLWNAVLVTVLCGALAALSYRFVERPALEWGARRRGRPRSMPVEQAVAAP